MKCNNTTNLRKQYSETLIGIKINKFRKYQLVRSRSRESG